MIQWKTDREVYRFTVTTFFPIIKKWLYSDHDIFVRELVSNGCDAVTKLKKLALMGEYRTPENETYQIQVEVSPKEKSIRFLDNGVGMSAEEVEKYINQIAFSGAQDFIETYKDKATEDQIIGHFGLGFYSAFMVADRVVIETKSYRENETAVHWESDGGTEYRMSDGTRKEHGTAITLILRRKVRSLPPKRVFGKCSRSIAVLCLFRFI